MDEEGEALGLYLCPDHVTVEQFEEALQDAVFSIEGFEDSNVIGAKRVFAEPVYMPTSLKLWKKQA
jgi:hypothetical protein